MITVEVKYSPEIFSYIIGLFLSSVGVLISSLSGLAEDELQIETHFVVGHDLPEEPRQIEHDTLESQHKRNPLVII